MSLPLADLPLFTLGSAALLWCSRKPLRRPGSHGFYRFFAWEAILALSVLNREPLGDQALSGALLPLSALLLVLGFAALRLQGRAAPGRADDAVLYSWEKTTVLITGGIYRWIRHPMYASLLALDWGMFFRAVGLAGFALACVASYFLLRAALAEELECLAHFGQPYLDYMQRTRRFVPWLF